MRCLSQRNTFQVVEMVFKHRSSSPNPQRNWLPLVEVLGYDDHKDLGLGERKKNGKALV